MNCIASEGGFCEVLIRLQLGWLELDRGVEGNRHAGRG